MLALSVPFLNTYAFWLKTSCTAVAWGDPSRNVVACSTCHGEGAQGNAIFPRLAGQHAAYVARQLEVIQRKFRDSPVMHGVIKDLDANDMEALAEYVQSK